MDAEPQGSEGTLKCEYSAGGEWTEGPPCLEGRIDVLRWYHLVGTVVACNL